VITVRDLLVGLAYLPIRGKAVIAHGSYKSLGEVLGGPQAVIDTLINSCDSLIMPTFTYQTMVTPLVGPPNNGLDYAQEDARRKRNAPGTLDAVPFQRDMPADEEMGVLAETLRQHSSARRSSHPILSFAGIHADFALERQTLYNPLAPIAALAERDGWVVLIGVDHSVNTSIHYAEKLAGRKQFIRWALVRHRIVQCPGFPGDSAGFDDIAVYLGRDIHSVSIGNARIQAVQLNRLFEQVKTLIKANPHALLCDRPECARCNEVRRDGNRSA
jgi:aminoglycoside 3-N-acetyltransferase